MSRRVADFPTGRAQTNVQAYANLVPATRATARVLANSIDHMRDISDVVHLSFVASSDDDFHAASINQHEAQDGAGINAFQLTFSHHQNNPRRVWVVGCGSDNNTTDQETHFAVVTPGDSEAYGIARIHAFFAIHPISGLITLRTAHSSNVVLIRESATTTSVAADSTHTFVTQRTHIRLGNLDYLLIYQVPRIDMDLQRLIRVRDSFLDTLYPSIRKYLPRVTRGLYPSEDGYQPSGHTFICRTINRGGFGTVSLAIDRNNANVIAVKIQTIFSEKALQAALQENERAHTFQNVNNLLASTACWTNPSRHSLRTGAKFPLEVSISMPLMLSNFENLNLRESLGPVDFVAAWWQIMNGIREMHERGLIHCDVSLANMAIANRNPLQVKLIDYGKTVEARFAIVHPCGPHFYNAPEVAKLARQESNIPYTSAIDVWSWGIALLISLGLRPWKNDYLNAQDLQQIRGFLVQLESTSPDKMPITSMLKRVLVENPIFRPTAHQVLADPYFRAYGL